jgi:hypothetical protein
MFVPSGDAVTSKPSSGLYPPAPDPGEDTNVSKGEGTAGGFPEAGDGPGTGRQPKTVKGQVKGMTKTNVQSYPDLGFASSMGKGK